MIKEIKAIPERQEKKGIKVILEKLVLKALKDTVPLSKEAMLLLLT